MVLFSFVTESKYMNFLYVCITQSTKSSGTMYDYIQGEVTELTPAYAVVEAVAGWASAAVDFCTDAQLMNGVTDTTFDRAGSANRAMGATVLVRLMEAAA